MRKFLFIFAAAFAFIFLSPASRASTQISVGIGIGGGNYGPEPVCPYGYYDYAPYNCSPYGYYGPEWFNGGVFIGAGRWSRGGQGFYGHVDNRYDPRYGYHGPFPQHTDQRFNHFHGNQYRNGQGQFHSEAQHASGNYSRGGGSSTGRGGTSGRSGGASVGGGGGHQGGGGGRH